MKKSTETLKSYFETGDQPTQMQYRNMLDSYLSKKEGGTVDAEIQIQRNLTQAHEWDTYEDRNQGSACLSLGRVLDTYNNGFKQRLLHFFDFPKNEALNEKESVFLGIEDQNNKGRFRFHAENGGKASLYLNDRNQQEFFKVEEQEDDKVTMHLAKPKSRLVIGETADYQKSNKLVVASGNALIEGKVEASKAVFNAVKLNNLGNGGVTDGAFTPVPTQGAGTMIFDNGSFYGFNGTQWKKLG